MAMAEFKMLASSFSEKAVLGGAMNWLALYATCLLLVASPVSAQSLSEKLGVNSFLGVSPSTQDFVNEVAMNDMLETELSKLAEERGGAKTKEFAAKMLKEHRGISSQLKSLVRSGQVKVTFPAILDNVRQAKLDQIKGMSGIGFDKAFEGLQVSIHNDTVSLFERYGGGGSHPDLKLFAFKHLPSLIEHWNEARDLKQ
jgi:putative membrane protein